jgi:hypothetical protein
VCIPLNDKSLQITWKSGAKWIPDRRRPLYTDTAARWITAVSDNILSGAFEQPFFSLSLTGDNKPMEKKM